MEPLLLTTVVFTVVFASQIYFLSIHVPRKFTARAAGECPGWQQALQTSRFYALANIALAAVGTGLLAAFFFVDVLAAMTPALLAVATFFFLQMAPLAIVAGPVLARPSEVARVTELAGPMRLADFVSPMAVALAVALAVGYIAMQLALWDGIWDKWLLAVAIFTVVQLFMAGTLIWLLWASGRVGTQGRAERVQAMEQMAPMFTLLSAGISLYYFGKDILFLLELQTLRPAMMSASLQLLALLAMHYVLRPRVSQSF